MKVAFEFSLICKEIPVTMTLAARGPALTLNLRNARYLRPPSRIESAELKVVINADTGLYAGRTKTNITFV